MSDRNNRVNPSAAAEITVFRDRRGWLVRFDRRDYGPHQDRFGAVRAAIDAARLAGRLGRTVRVREVVGPARERLLWPLPNELPRRVSAA